LVKSIDAQIAKNPTLKSFVVILSDDSDKNKAKLEELAKDCRLKSIPLTISEDPEGPPHYKIAEDADVTVLMWKLMEVKANHAYTKGKFTEADVKTIVSDLPKILGD
jgi:hypothetical protein